MPKLKSNKAVRKRFRVTKSGKVLASATLKRHLLTDRSSKRKRHARGTREIDIADQTRIRKMLPYG